MMFNKKNVFIGKNVVLGKNVRIGDNTIVYDNVIIGDNSVIAANCVIGEPINDYYHSDRYINPSLEIGENALIRSNTIIYAGSKIGCNFQSAHYVTIRESNKIGDNCVVGMYTHILNGCTIGNYARFHSYDSIGENSEIGDFVFFYPFVTITTDPTPPSNELLICKIGEFTQIASGCLLLPGAEIGRHCLIGVQSRVGGRFKDFSFIAGTPARRIMDVRQAPIVNRETRKRQYPWPYNFSRNMPWAECGFDQWLETNNRKL